MRHNHSIRISTTAAAAALALGCGLLLAAEPPAGHGAQRAAAARAYQEGNYDDALALYRRLTTEPANDPRRVGADLDAAVRCLNRLGRVHEADALLEEAVKANAKNWRLLFAAARNYQNLQHHGYIIAGEFRRGHHRGGGKWVNCQARDRVRALQLMDEARPLTAGDSDPHAVASFYLRFADAILAGGRGHNQSWRLQYLSDLSKLPDCETSYYHRGPAVAAPVRPNGSPVFYAVPTSFEAASNDGERWRWLLVEAMELVPRRTNEVRRKFADFLHQQFGVQTMRTFVPHGRSRGAGPEEGDESGTYALHTLGAHETIAKLAVGIKRFRLPDEFNFIKIYGQIADDRQWGYGENALRKLAEIYENRRQYTRAAEIWRRNIREHGSSKQKRDRLSQIEDNWGQFEPIMTQPAGRGATVEYRFRNGTQVEFTAHALRIRDLLADVKAYLKANPRKLQWETLEIQRIGYRLMREGEAKYRGRQVASWTQELTPRERHFDKRVTITTPLTKAGAYLLTARMADGNTSKIVVWLSDTVIVRKPLDGGVYYFVADAVSGKPIPKANLEFFGYRRESTKFEKLVGRRYNVAVENFAEYTDADGQLVLKSEQQNRRFSWVVIATTPDERLAYLGFSNVWYNRYYDREYNQTKIYVITDRPVYRPSQPVKFKFWVRHAQYDKDESSAFANRPFTVRINDPKGEKVYEQLYHSDVYGGFDGEFMLPADAALGQYYIFITGRSGGHFRVEEYKKPEFEVQVDAPTEPVMLGETITATIRAKYYFGAPVTKATVKYKVLRSSYGGTWYPAGPWDWFYGPGYWWFAYDYVWYPHWSEWGCVRPRHWWIPFRRDPPEVVMENEVQIGPDGTVAVRIDTGVAKEIHGNTDHRYELTAEVVDESRRTIVGNGQVLVARSPFKVYAWVDRGHYRVGDTVHATFSAQTLDKNPVQGAGRLILNRISYTDERMPVETPVQEWKLATDAQGRAAMQITAARAGQYRLSYTVTDQAGHTIEGGYVFVVRGEGFDAAQFRFNHLELVPEKREYRPGEKVQLMVNTDRAESTVVLFLRPANGVYQPPKVLRLTGKSTIEQVAVTMKDMPNFFVEAFTIADGKIHGDTREIIVPPEKRVLNVKLVPDQKEYKPGKKARVKVKLTDFFGEPFVGSTVITIYDKAVEYIAGGSNVPEIKAFFWKWRRRHNKQELSSLARYFTNMTERGKPRMRSLGVFGDLVADELDDGAGTGHGGRVEEAKGRARRKSVGRMMAAPSVAAAPMMAKEGVAMEMAADSVEAEAPAEGGAAQPAVVEPVVRKEFADTAFWAGNLETDRNGEVRIELTMPENLTGWRIKTWAVGHGTKVGEGQSEVVTKKDLMLRMQAPRFFVEKDEVVLSANVHNYLATDKSVQARLELDGPCLRPMDGLERTVTVAADGEQRVDWRVKVAKEGEALIRMFALTDEESDAMELRFPVYVHGMLKMEAFSGVIRPAGESAQVTIEVPAERRVEESRLEIRYSPSLAGAMVDALPYLAAYPYGCTEQTLSRFLPAVVTQKILREMGLDLAAIEKKRTNLNAQELGDDAARAKQWKRWRRNPVFDNELLVDMVKTGVKRMTAMQLSDGGWGWFSGWGEQSWPHTTAYVVHGLQVALENDVALVPGVLDRGVKWLERYQAEQVRRLENAPSKKKPWKRHADNLDAFVYMVLVDAKVANPAMREFLYRDRNRLAVYAKAMFGLALHKQNEAEKLAMILRNIEQYLKRDQENQTAHLELPNAGYWWYWYGSEYEAHAYYLKLLCRTDPTGWKAPGLVKYLLNNRKHATYWNSTRDTALCVEAMADYIRATG